MDSALIAADLASMARFFRVLGNPTRMRLLQVLDEGERSVNELVAAVGLQQPRVSTHLACLRHCGFVESRRAGQEVIYRLCLPGVIGMLRGASEIMDPVSERLATCTRIGPDWV